MRMKVSTRLRALVIGGAAAAVVAAVGVGIAVAVNAGTAGELNYQRKTFVIQGVISGESQTFTKKVKCPTQRHVTGGGAKGDANAGAQDGRPFDSADAGNVPDDGWAVTATIFGTNAGNLTVYAICDD